MSWPSLRLTHAAAVQLLVVCLVVLAAQAWYPFDVELPLWRASEPDRTEAGVSFNGDGDTLASGISAGWLAEAARSGRLTVALEARTDDDDQRGPARLLSISQSHYLANLMIGQEGDDLVVRLRRPDSDRSGDPPYRVRDVFGADEWRRLDVVLRDGQARIAVDGIVHHEDTIGPELLTDWDVTHRLSLGDDVAGERSWRGQLRVVQLTVGDGPPVDVLGADDLAPAGGWRLRSRVRALLGSGSDDPVVLSALRVLVFVPVGMALRRILGRRAAAVAGVTVAALVITVGKAFVASRHPALVDTVLSVVGGVLGVVLWDGRLRRRRPGTGPTDRGRADGAAGVLPGQRDDLEQRTITR